MNSCAQDANSFSSVFFFPTTKLEVSSVPGVEEKG